QSDEVVTEILPPEEAFILTAELSTDQNTLLVHWQLPPNLYLYDDKFAFKVREGGQLGKFELSPGIPKEDEVLGKYFVHYAPVTLSVPIVQRDNDRLLIDVDYQGCADSGYCYPPMTSVLLIESGIDGGQSRLSFIDSSGIGSSMSTATAAYEDIAQLFFDNSLWLILLAFLGFGILLTFTPCVLPMVPILAGIIIGQGHHITRRHAFMLSLVYVLGMAVTYALLGVIAGFAGQGLQAAFQKPWVIITLSSFFVLLSLSMFGFYELRLPAKLETRIAAWSQHQKSGTYLGCLILGVLSALIVSPCVTVPLVGALAYIGQTGDAVLGGLALFSLALGMGIPLMLVAALGGHLLPKAGAWMKTVSAVFGVLLLGLAIWLLERVIPGEVVLVLWAALAMVSAIYLGALEAAPQGGWPRLWKGLGCLLFAYSILLLVGASLGNQDPLRPLANLSLNGQPQGMLAPGSSQKVNGLFKLVKSLDEVQDELALAQQTGQPVMLDFYADWCASCVKMKRTTFADPLVHQALSDFVVLQADVTKNDMIDKELQKYFSVYAPPAILFFNINGQENKAARLVGEIGTQAFLNHLRQL
ncbi:MAG: protein-disulfide reductase DsbD, partial [Gammaproteobacteria bacterium]